MQSTAPKSLVETHNNGHGSAATPAPSLPNFSQDAFHGPLGKIVQGIKCETPPAVLLALTHAATGVLFGSTPGVQVGATMHAPQLNLALIDQDRSGLRTALDIILDLVTAGDPTSKSCISHTFPGATKKKDAAAETQQDLHSLVILHGIESLCEQAGQIAQTFYPQSPSNPVSNPHTAFISMLGRPHLLDLDKLDAFACGYGQYCIWLLSCRTAVVPRPLPLDDDRKAEFSRLVEEVKAYMVAMAGIGFSRLSFSGEAADLWADIYPNLSAPTPGLLGLVLRYAPLHVLRLTLNYARCDCAATISASHLRAAHAFWQSAACAAEIFANRGIDDLQNRILAHLRTGGGRLTKSDLSKRLSHHKKSHELDSALLALQHAGLIYLERRHTGGRSAMDICLKAR